MPKLIRPIGSSKKPAPKPVKSLTELVADAADRECVYAMDMIRFPEMLKRQGLPEHVSHNVAQAADQLNKKLMEELRAKYERKTEYADLA